MRVTKLIKEYVEEEVRNALANYKEEELKVLKEKDAEIKEYINNINEKLRNENKKIIEEIIQKFDIKDNEPDNRYRHSLETRYDPIEYNSYYTTLRKEIDKIDQERRTKINETIKNILIELELGATKKDLDQMIKDLGKEV